MSRARNTADGVARSITDGIVVDADINASAAIAQSKVANLSTDLSGKVDYALPTNAQNGSGVSAYTFALADARRLTTATNALAKTFTIPPQSSVVWVNNSVVNIVNYGAGILTIAGGVGVTVTNATKTLAQFESAALIRTGSDAWTLVPFSGGGVSNADFSNTATGTYTDTGINYKYVTFTGTGTLTVTKAGLCDVLVVGGGGGGHKGVQSSYEGPGGGGGQVVTRSNIYLFEGSNTVTVGAGGSGGTGDGGSGGSRGTDSNFNGLFIALGGAYPRSSPGSVGSSAAGGGGSNSGVPATPVPPAITGTGSAGSGASAAGAGGGAGGNASGTTGGIGIANLITNTSITYAKGGNAAVASGGAGVANRGEGGAGGLSTGSTNGFAGGSGVIIVRVKV